MRPARAMRKPSSTMPATRSNPNFATPDDAEQAFYEALEQRDLDALMSVWSEDDEIVCVHPGGPRTVGHGPVRAAWAEVLANGPVRIRIAQVHANHGMMVAVHNLIEQIIVTSPQGQQVVQVVASNVYFKGPAGWRLVLHHASPASDQPGNAAPERGAVLH